MSVPELDGRGYGHVIEYPYAQFAGGVAAQDRAEKDGFEVGTGVLFCQHTGVSTNTEVIGSKGTKYQATTHIETVQVTADIDRCH